jgi:hypothetical protein
VPETGQNGLGVKKNEDICGVLISVMRRVSQCKKSGKGERDVRSSMLSQDGKRGVAFLLRALLGVVCGRVQPRSVLSSGR